MFRILVFTDIMFLEYHVQDVTQPFHSGSVRNHSIPFCPLHVILEYGSLDYHGIADAAHLLSTTSDRYSSS